MNFLLKIHSLGSQIGMIFYISSERTGQQALLSYYVVAMCTLFPFHFLVEGNDQIFI